MSKESEWANTNMSLQIMEWSYFGEHAIFLSGLHAKSENQRKLNVKSKKTAHKKKS